MFALLNDDSSDDEGPKQVTKSAPAPAPARQERKPERKPRAPREDRSTRDNTPYDGGDKVSNPAADRDRQGKGGRSGKGKGNRGKGEGSRGDSGREYPRRSGTGRGRENAKSGGGKYNWGKEDGTNQAAADTPTEEVPAEGAPAEETETKEEEEAPTLSFEEYEKLQAEKTLNLNSNVEERAVEQDPDAKVLTHEGIEDQYACMFHDQASKQKHAKKGARRGAKQADQVLNLKFVDENESSGKGKGNRKGDGRKGDGRKGGGQGGKGHNNSKNIDLSNDMAFPTLGA
jgi:hypothetical protein